LDGGELWLDLPAVKGGAVVGEGGLPEGHGRNSVITLEYRASGIRVMVAILGVL
jgi:hypothetical protein